MRKNKTKLYIHKPHKQTFLIKRKLLGSFSEFSPETCLLLSLAAVRTIFINFKHGSLHSRDLGDLDSYPNGHLFIYSVLCKKRDSVL